MNMISKCRTHYILSVFQKMTIKWVDFFLNLGFKMLICLLSIIFIIYLLLKLSIYECVLFKM